MLKVLSFLCTIVKWEGPFQLHCQAAQWREERPPGGSLYTTRTHLIPMAAAISISLNHLLKVDAASKLFTLFLYPLYGRASTNRRFKNPVIVRIGGWGGRIKPILAMSGFQKCLLLHALPMCSSDSAVPTHCHLKSSLSGCTLPRQGPRLT